MNCKNQTGQPNKEALTAGGVPVPCSANYFDELIEKYSFSDPFVLGKISAVQRKSALLCLEESNKVDSQSTNSLEENTYQSMVSDLHSLLESQGKDLPSEISFQIKQMRNFLIERGQDQLESQSGYWYKQLQIINRISEAIRYIPIMSRDTKFMYNEFRNTRLAGDGEKAAYTVEMQKYTPTADGMKYHLKIVVDTYTNYVHPVDSWLEQFSRRKNEHYVCDDLLWAMREITGTV